MEYTVKLFEADGASDAERRLAEQRFRQTLEATLGAPGLVVPVYRAYQRIAAAYGEPPATEVLSEAERAIVAQWLAAESAAVAAAFGSHRYMGDACYEIVCEPSRAAAPPSSPSAA